MLHAERNVIRALISWINHRDSDSDNNSRTTISERIASTKKDTMSRTLPWLTGDAVKKEATPQKRAIKRDPDPESDHEETPKASKDIGYSDKSDILKSSSPPADPIRRCPSEEYLIEGFDNDDIWMMVEDEFYAVAQTFTQHLHYAEYIRRTKEAKLQNAARIQDLSRSTDSVTPMSEETKKKRETEALAERQKKGLGHEEEKKGAGSGGEEGAGDLDDDDDDDDALFQDDAWAGTSLYDLMISPRKARSLVDSRGIKSSTKAAAGYAQASQDYGSDARSGDGSSAAAAEPPSSPLGHRAHTVVDDAASDDDLNVQPKTTLKRAPQDIKAPKSENNVSTKLSIAPTKCVAHKPINAMRESGIKPGSTPSIRERNKASTVPKPRKRMLFDDDFDKLPEPKPNDIPMHATPTKRNPSSSIRDKQPPDGSRGGDDGIKLESKRSRLNEVPTFLL